MLTKCIESIIIFLINHIMTAVARAKANRSGTGQGGASQAQPEATIGLFSRLIGRRPAAAAAPTRQASDPPVVIGKIIPSAREALRQRNAAPVTVSLTTEMRTKHVYCLGKSGLGKTNYNVHMIDSDYTADRAVVLIDYRGDLIDRICKRLVAKYDPDEVADRLLIVDLRSPPDAAKSEEGVFTVGFNPLAQCGRTPYARGLFTFDIFQQYFGGALGVQTSETLQNCLLALALTGGNILDVEPLLSSETFRAETLARIEDGSIRRFFARLAALPEAQRTLWVNPIQNKLAPFTINPVLRAVLGNSQSVSIQDFLDRRPDGIILFCAGADEHYGSTAVMMSNLFVNAVASAIMRTDRASHHNVYLYVDEFQNLYGDKFSEIISEGRRFGICLTISHQSTSQLEPKIRSLIRNVVSTSLFFGVGGLDADLLAGEIPSDEPKTVLKNLLINQKPGEAMLLRQGMAAVRIKTPHAPDPDVSAARVQALRQASLRRHGRPMTEVEADLRAREALFLPPPEQHVGNKAVGGWTGPARARKANKPDPHKSAPHAEEEYEVRDNDEAGDNEVCHNEEVRNDDE